ncbi:glycosyltransferase family 2 protein [Nanoarchaeota archaeon]
MRNASTFVVIPAYNEGKAIAKVIKDLKKGGYKNIIIIDDCSTDNTAKVAEKEKVIVLKHAINRGQGAALKTGIDFALMNKADIIITFDADGQHRVEDIKNLIRPITNKKADITLGSRFLGKAVNIPFLKKVVLKLGTIVVFFLYRIKVTDSQSGLRALSRKAAEAIDIRSDRMEHAGEIFHEIIRNNLKYVEVPITVIYDEYAIKKGQSWTKGFELGIKMIFRRLTK